MHPASPASSSIPLRPGEHFAITTTMSQEAPDSSTAALKLGGARPRRLITRVFGEDAAMLQLDAL